MTVTGGISIARAKASITSHSHSPAPPALSALLTPRPLKHRKQTSSTTLDSLENYDLTRLKQVNARRGKVRTSGRTPRRI